MFTNSNVGSCLDIDLDKLHTFITKLNIMFRSRNNVMMGDKRKAVVCKQGHVGDYDIKLDVDYNGEPNCGRCGNRFLINCTSCGSYIKGRTQYDHVINATPFYPDNNCFNCGKSYPWKYTIKFKPDMRFSLTKMSLLNKIYLISGCIASVIIIIKFVIN